MKTNIFKFLISILVCEGAGIIGSIFTAKSIPTWYAALNKPAINPPNFIFAPVWTTLFFLMGVSLFLVWKKIGENPKAKNTIILFLTHLFVNVLWSVLFFGLNNPFLAFLCIILFWFLILVCIVKFYRINKVAGLILLPYILWVSFASVLNFLIWRLN